MDLKKELEKRNQFIRAESKKILNEFKDILDVAVNCISLNEFDIKWISIDFHPRSDLFINVIGFLNHKVGDIIKNTYNDESIMIDETNVKNYIKPIRIILPIDIIQNKNEEELFKFMEEYIALTINLHQEEIEDMLKDDTFLESSFSLFKHNKNILQEHKRSIFHDEFDLTKLELDEIQLQFLKMGYPEGKS